MLLVSLGLEKNIIKKKSKLKTLFKLIGIQYV